MACNKIDSNVTGLRIAEEDIAECIAVLPASPTWYAHEPNSYADFGGSITNTPRRPINNGRQRKKGPTTDLDASGGFNTDVTPHNLKRLLQGYFFADLRLKAQTDQDIIGRDGGSVPVINVDGTTEEYELSNLELTAIDAVAAGGTTYVVGDVLTLVGGTFSPAATITVTEVAAGVVTAAEITTPGRYSVAPSDPVATTGGGDNAATFNLTFSAVATYAVGDLLFADSNFAETSNQGLKRITTVTTDTLLEVAEDLVDETPSTSASLTVVGFQFDASDAAIDASGTFPILTTVTKDLTELGIVPGEFVFLGGDAAATQFATAADNGFARVRSVTANAMTFDKTDSTMATDAGTGKTIQLFVGSVLKNEAAALIKRRTYQMERTLGEDADGTQSEYLVGAVPSEMSLNIPTADKMNADLSFVATDHETRDGATGVKSGTRPTLISEDAFNTSSDFSRIKLGLVSSSDSNVTPLFAYATEITLTVNNNISPAKAVGTLGAFDVTAGDFVVSGKMTAYFQDVAAVAAVRANSDVTMDMAIVRSNTGIVLDIPLIALGNGRLTVEQDKPILLPLDTEAADGSNVNANLNHTLLMVFFDYLPSAADT